MNSSGKESYQSPRRECVVRYSINKHIIKYFDEDAYKCLIKKVIIGENDNDSINPYVLKFVLNSDSIKSNEEFDDLKMQIAEIIYLWSVHHMIWPNVDEHINL